MADGGVEQATPPRRIGKSASAFRTISEVATELDVPQHVLRFWESRFPQIRPVKRSGGRRYYRPEDVDLLRRIRHSLYVDGYTIKGVQKLLREGGAPPSPAAAPATPAEPAGITEIATVPRPEQTGTTASAEAVPRRVVEAILGELLALRDYLRRVLR